jgi:hypothetical protein
MMMDEVFFNGVANGRRDNRKLVQSHSDRNWQS